MRLRAIAANFFVSAAILIPAATILANLPSRVRLSEQSAGAILLLLVGTLAASAAGRVFYQMALTATRDDNGYVTMFFLLIPALSALISLMLSRLDSGLAVHPRAHVFLRHGARDDPALSVVADDVA